MARFIFALLTISLLTATVIAFSVTKTGDRWRRAMIIDEDSDDQIPPNDDEMSYGLDGASVVNLANDGVEEYVRAYKRRESSGFRNKLKDILEENGSKKEFHDNKEDVDDEEDGEDNRDHVRVAASTNAFLSRSRRPMTSSNGSLRVVVDTLVVVDNRLYKRALRRHRNNANDTVRYIKKYYRQVIALVDARYSQIQDTEFSIRVRLAGIYIAQKRSGSPWSENHVRQFNNSMALDPNVGLEKFKEWLKTKPRKLPKFDHAMGFTGFVCRIPSGPRFPDVDGVRMAYADVDGVSNSASPRD